MRVRHCYFCKELDLRLLRFRMMYSLERNTYEARQTSKDFRRSTTCHARQVRYMLSKKVQTALLLFIG